eukprot:m.25420 g.25420  ORF g.25420 m.25420 type:complete len:418 (-) comp11365_c0_seq1:149-1402(-)
MNISLLLPERARGFQCYVCNAVNDRGSNKAKAPEDITSRSASRRSGRVQGHLAGILLVKVARIVHRRQRRLERRLNFPSIQFVPVDAIEKRLFFHFIRSVGAQSRVGHALEQLSQQRLSFLAQKRGHGQSRAQNHVHCCFAVVRAKGQISRQHLKHQHTVRPPVCSLVVASAADNFWRHVFHCPAEREGFACVVIDAFFAQAKVGQGHVPHLVQQDVFWLQVAVHNAIRVEMLQGQAYFSKVKSHILFREHDFAGQACEEIAALQKVHDQIQLALRLECVVQAHNKRVADGHQNVAFSFGAETVTHFQGGLLQGLHGIQCALVLARVLTHQKHLAERALTQNFEQIKVCAVDLLVLLLQVDVANFDFVVGLFLFRNGWSSNGTLHLHWLLVHVHHRLVRLEQKSSSLRKRHACSSWL